MFDFSCASFVFYHPHTQYTSTDIITSSALHISSFIPGNISCSQEIMADLQFPCLKYIYCLHNSVSGMTQIEMKKYTQIWIYIITSVHCFFAPTPSFLIFWLFRPINLIEIVHSCQIFHYFWQWNKRIPFSPHFNTNCYNYKISQ